MGGHAGCRSIPGTRQAAPSPQPSPGLSNPNALTLLLRSLGMMMTSSSSPAATSSTASFADRESGCSGVHEVADVADDDDEGVDELLKLEARPRPVGVSTVSSCVWASVRGRKVRTSRSRCGEKTVRLDARA